MQMDKFQQISTELWPLFRNDFLCIENIPWLGMLHACSAFIEAKHRVPTSSGNHGKPGKSLKKFHAWKNHGI